MAEAVLSQAIENLKKHHVRITPQRKQIINYLITHDNHPTVETLFTDLHREEPNLSLATVYNTLNLLVSLGIVIELSNETGGVRYDYFGNPHFHAVCDNCGKIFDVFYKNFPKIETDLKQATQQQSSFNPTSAHIEIHGLCADCQQLLR